MTNEVSDYMKNIELALLSSTIILEYVIVRSWVGKTNGYIRIRASLINGDFLESAEYFILENKGIRTIDYRHQWMSGDKKTMRKRWDNTPDHPEIETFPHHVHIEQEERVFPSTLLSLTDLLILLENEIDPTVASS
jgi:hypothetical protein